VQQQQQPQGHDEIRAHTRRAHDGPATRGRLPGDGGRAAEEGPRRPDDRGEEASHRRLMSDGGSEIAILMQP
jgi:hypothetical protein